MIDTLGMNAKSIKSYVKGHSELYKPDGRKREDFDLEEEWCLIEIPEIERLETEVSDELENGKIQSVQETLDLCKGMQMEVGKRKILSIYLDSLAQS